MSLEQSNSSNLYHVDKPNGEVPPNFALEMNEADLDTKGAIYVVIHPEVGDLNLFGDVDLDAQAAEMQRIMAEKKNLEVIPLESDPNVPAVIFSDQNKDTPIVLSGGYLGKSGSGGCVGSQYNALVRSGFSPHNIFFSSGVIYSLNDPFA
jgi:hypothetical protein